MTTNPVWEICERIAEVQALLHDHAECGKHTATDVVAKAQAVLSEPALRSSLSRSAPQRCSSLCIGGHPAFGRAT
jgi:hypothetical protein